MLGPRIAPIGRLLAPRGRQTSRPTKRKRRLALLDDILARIQPHMRRVMPDPFAPSKGLDEFDIHAGDGHFIAAASHGKAAAMASIVSKIELPAGIEQVK